MIIVRINKVSVDFMVEGGVFLLILRGGIVDCFIFLAGIRVGMGRIRLPAPSVFVKRAVRLHVTDAKIIDPRRVVTGEWVRLKCQFGCDGYGQHLTCPPFSPTPSQTRRVLDEYQTAVLIHYDSEEWREVDVVVSTLEREAFLAGYYKALGLGSGPCSLCETCNLGGGCRHAEQARPSMEACGIDVYATARAAGFPIEVVKGYSSPQNYYGLLLLL
jgi:predicted metal-binding protein